MAKGRAEVYERQKAAQASNADPSGPDFSDPGTIYSMFEGLQAPAPRDLGGELDTLLQYSPQFYQQTLGLMRDGMLGDEGLVNTFGTARWRETQQGLNRLNDYGQHYANEIRGLYDSLYQAPESSEILKRLEAGAIEGLDAGMGLTDDENRLIQQASRTAYNDRGMARGNAAIGDELLQTYGMGRQAQDQRRQFALQVDQVGESRDQEARNRALGMSGAISDTLLNPTPASAGYAASLTGQAPAGSQYASGLFSQNYEGAFAGYNNEANLLASLYGGQMQMDAANNAASASKSAGAMSAFGSLGGMALMGLAMSDQRLKENITRKGTTPGGLPWYSYHYKGDPTRREGVMAQEIIDLAPDAVIDLGGLLAVDYAKVR